MHRGGQASSTVAEGADLPPLAHPDSEQRVAAALGLPFCGCGEIPRPEVTHGGKGFFCLTTPEGESIIVGHA